MRRLSSLGVLAVLILVLTGCQLHSDNKKCVADPGGAAGGGVSVCTKPAPTQFSQLGQ